MAALFLPVAVLLSLLVTGATADGYGSQTTPSTSTPTSYTPTPATPPPPTPTPHAMLPKPAHSYDNNDDDKLAVVVLVVVEGLVLCQSCVKRGLDGAAPLPKAQVMVTCGDGKHRAMAVADSDGYFHAEFSVKRVDDFGTKDPRGACFVRLHSSPDPKCNIISDIHAGWHGAPLRDEGKHLIDGRGGRKVVHAARPLAFRPRRCAPTHHH